MTSDIIAGMIYRFLTQEEMVSLDPFFEASGWGRLNVQVAQVAGAFDGDKLVEIFTLQLYPMLGPMAKVDGTVRDSGEVSRGLANFMEQYLKETGTRGVLTIADSVVTERLCRRFGMTEIRHPVFIHVPNPPPSGNNPNTLN